MSKIDNISTAFAVVHTQKEIEKLENKIFTVLEDIEPVRIYGLDGERGDRGPQGARGDTGEKGEKGDTGPQGPKGDTGATGDRGEVGAKGDAGPKGDVGLQGVQGIQGLKGDTGDTGLRGADGQQGAPGPQGVKGDRGEKGETGKTGSMGQQGVAGIPGDRGERGLPGDTGPMGPKGDRGERGEVGAKGAPGRDGKDGSDHREEFEEALKQFNEKLTKNANKVEGNLSKQIDRINRSLASLGGGGSYKILDNADVDKTKLSSIVGDSILIYDPTKNKFVVESFISILDRIKADLEVQYNKLIDQVGTFYYIGEALPGTGEAEATWRIKRIEEVGEDYNILWASGTANFDKIWDDRLTLTYS